MEKIEKISLVLVKEEKTVICCSCYQEVLVTLIPFGRGRIAVCPLCDRLAYNGN